MSHIGVRIRHAREQKGLTQKQLAENINKTRPLISQIEQTGLVNQLTLNSILKALGLSQVQLMSGEFVTEQKYWFLSEEMKRLKEQNQELQEEIKAARELVKAQRHLIDMMDRVFNGKLS